MLFRPFDLPMTLRTDWPTRCWPYSLINMKRFLSAVPICRCGLLIELERNVLLLNSSLEWFGKTALRRARVGSFWCSITGSCQTARLCQNMICKCWRCHFLASQVLYGETKRNHNQLNQITSQHVEEDFCKQSLPSAFVQYSTVIHCQPWQVLFPSTPFGGRQVKTACKIVPKKRFGVYAATEAPSLDCYVMLRKSQGIQTQSRFLHAFSQSQPGRKIMTQQ